MTPEREETVRRALELYSGSARSLAREAGISHGLLGMIMTGDRSATPETVKALAGALRRMSERHADAARILEDSLSEEEADDE